MLAATVDRAAAIARLPEPLRTVTEACLGMLARLSPEDRTECVAILLAENEIERLHPEQAQRAH
jgi:hypothetical protein